MKVVFYDDENETLHSFDCSATWVSPREREDIWINNSWYVVQEIEHDYSDLKNPILEINLREY